ncbi:MAG: hypothetical protein K9G60_14600 [Pseudolabrys sp.]|nr:hypothetical protein [Pseudolabrys sp.]
MNRSFALATLLCTVVASPAFADTYPVSGKWGLSTSGEKGPIDCSKLRVITFNDGQRTDTGGGVPAFRNRTVRAHGPSRYRVVDEFTTGQIANAQVEYTLHMIDDDHLELNMEKGGLQKLLKCK